MSGELAVCANPRGLGAFARLKSVMQLSHATLARYLALRHMCAPALRAVAALALRVVAILPMQAHASQVIRLFDPRYSVTQRDDSLLVGSTLPSGNTSLALCAPARSINISGAGNSSNDD